jgi:hypothetical protein
MIGVANSDSQGDLRCGSGRHPTVKVGQIAPLAGSDVGGRFYFRQPNRAGASFIRALSTLRHFLARPSVAGQNQSSVTIRAQADDADCIGGNP